MMKNKAVYKVQYSHSDYGFVDIPANSEEEAIEKCSKMFNKGRLRKYDMNEAWDAQVVEVKDISDNVKEAFPSKFVQCLNETSFLALEPSRLKSRFESLMDSMNELLEEKEEDNE